MNVYISGLYGEMRAAIFLKKHGIKVIEKRFHFADGEIDIIAADKDTLCFVEVKYRPRGRIGEGVRSVDRNKIGRIRRAAEGYIKTHGTSGCQKCRYDIIEITASGIRFLKNAF